MEKAELSEGLAQTDLAGSCPFGVNNAETGEKIDTPLTQVRSAPVRGYVYFIWCGEHIKIGFSTRPLDRLRALQTSHPDELEILGTIKGTRALESKLHERFEHLRERGEWFQAAAELWDYIDNHTAERKAEMDLRLSPEARSMIGRLSRLRNAHDPESAMGHASSNLIEQIYAMADYVRPAWATHECQTLPGMIKRQVARLAQHADHQG